MTQAQIRKLLTTLIIMLFTTQAFGAESEEFPYPELTVSPSATERLKDEYRREKSAPYFQNHLAIQASSLTTLVAGLTHDEKDPEKNTATLSTAVGGGWLLATVALDAFYRPYRSGLVRARRVKGNSKKDRLTRERYAEEALYDAASLGRKLDYLSAISNGLTSTYMLTNVEGESFGEPLAVISLVSSIAPLIFSNHWTDVGEKHRSYKKKIYGSISFHPAVFKQDEHLASGLRLAVTF